MDHMKKKMNHWLIDVTLNNRTVLKAQMVKNTNTRPYSNISRRVKSVENCLFQTCSVKQHVFFLFWIVHLYHTRYFREKKNILHWYQNKTKAKEIIQIHVLCIHIIRSFSGVQYELFVDFVIVNSLLKNNLHVFRSKYTIYTI